MDAVANSTLTRRQADVLDFIRAFQSEKGFGPSYKEIAAATGRRSVSGIFQTVRALKERGLLRKSPYLARQYELTGDSALVHLRVILAVVGETGCLFKSDSCVADAMRFLGRAT